MDTENIHHGIFLREMPIIKANNPSFVSFPQKRIKALLEPGPDLLRGGLLLSLQVIYCRVASDQHKQTPYCVCGGGGWGQKTNKLCKENNQSQFSTKL